MESDILKIEQIYERAMRGEFYNIARMVLDKIDKHGPAQVNKVREAVKYVNEYSIGNIKNQVDKIREKNIGTQKTKKRKKFNGDNISDYLLEDENELKLYEFRKNKYLEDFDFNNSSDQVILHQILMVEVGLFRLQNDLKNLGRGTRKDKEKQSTEIQKKIIDMNKQLKSLLETLGTDRKLRTGGKGAKNAFDISELATRYESQRENKLKEKVNALKENQEKYQKSQNNRLEELKEMGVTEMRASDFSDLNKKR